jgi:RNA polymerase sigma-32 factor
LEEPISEDHVGLTRAVCRFDLDRGVRFATCAFWWVRPAAQGYVLNNWSPLKMGTTAAQKKMFFNLRHLRRRLQKFDDGASKSEHVGKIANMLGMSAREVIRLVQRQAVPDRSLYFPIAAGSQSEWHAWLMHVSDDQKTVLVECEDASCAEGADDAGTPHHRRTSS